MKITSACHNHTTFCDGKATPAAMAAAAYARGFTDFGFSGHSHTHYAQQPNYGVKDENAYVAYLRALRQEYADRMNIAIGMEQDYYAPVQNRAALDFLIGAVHDFYDPAQNRYYWVDGDAETLQACKANLFGGDGLAMAKAFYALTAKNVLENRPDVIAHFDLIVKNNAGDAFFDEEAPAYRAAALEALHACMETGAVFELNTGGMFRGYRNTPYPARFLLEELRRCGARVMVNADAHTPEAVDFWFAEAVELLKEVGFSAAVVLQNGKFVQKSL